MFSSSDTYEDTHDEEDDEEGEDQIEVETVVPYRDSDSESEPEQLKSVSDFELLSGSDEEDNLIARLNRPTQSTDSIDRLNRPTQTVITYQ